MSNPVVPGFRGLFRRLFDNGIQATPIEPPPLPVTAAATGDVSRWWPSYYKGPRFTAPRSVKKRARKAAKAARRNNR